MGSVFPAKRDQRVIIGEAHCSLDFTDCQPPDSAITDHDAFAALRCADCRQAFVIPLGRFVSRQSVDMRAVFLSASLISVGRGRLYFSERAAKREQL